MLDLLVTPAPAQLRVGTHIAKNQPDVEVCAMSLCKLPSNRTEFDAMRGTREFIIGKFLVLAVGPPGFGKVPYNSKRSAGQKEEAGQPLYETAEAGRVRLYSFEKGKTNKDKGDRVDAPESNGLLQPGLVLSFFLREDFWDPPKIAPSAAGSEEIAVGTMLALQLASGNVEAASKGYLVKLKKARVLDAGADLSATLARLPHTEEEHDSLAAKFRTDYPAMKGAIDSQSDLRCFALQNLGPDACVFAHEDGFLISNSVTGSCEGFRDDIFVPPHVLLQSLHIADSALAVKFLNVALALQAVGVLVKSCANNVLLSAEDEHPLVALALVVDLNVLLSLDALSAPEVGFFLRSPHPGPIESRDLHVSKQDDHIHWHNATQVYTTAADAAQVSFTLHAASHTGPDDAPAATGQLSIGCSGAYKTLSVNLTRNGVSRKIVDLEMRAATSGGARLKRKRPELMGDDEL